MKNWVNESIFYQIYPLGFCGAPRFNDMSKEPEPRIKKIIEWIPHLKDLGVNALYLGPIFESSEHGYDTADYRVIDRRLGTNEDFKEVFKKRLNTEVCKRGAEKHRSKLALSYLFNIKFKASAVKQL